MAGQRIGHIGSPSRSKIGPLTVCQNDIPLRIHFLVLRAGVAQIARPNP